MFPTRARPGHFPARASRRSTRSFVRTVTRRVSQSDGSHDGRSHPRHERVTRGSHAPIGDVHHACARSRRQAGVRRAPPWRRLHRRERALTQRLAQAGHRPRGRRGAFLPNDDLPYRSGATVGIGLSADTRHTGFRSLAPSSPPLSRRVSRPSVSFLATRDHVTDPKPVARTAGRGERRGERTPRRGG